MEKLVFKISQFRRHLEDLLENGYDSNREEKEKTKTHFQITKDDGLIRGIAAGLPDNHLDRMAVLFTKMSLFFEAGVMLENTDNHWKAQAYFEKGVIETLKSQIKSEVQIPNIELLKVLKTSSLPLLQKLNLTFLDPQNNYQCLLIKVSSDFAFLLFSPLPDIWLKEHAEKIVAALQSGIAD